LNVRGTGMLGLIESVTNDRAKKLKRYKDDFNIMEKHDKMMNLSSVSGETILQEETVTFSSSLLRKKSPSERNIVEKQNGLRSERVKS
jgi:hypothetical protein